MMKIVSVVGARPEFVQAAPISRVLQAAGCKEILIHTGQHYDYAMSQVFFQQLGLPTPAHNLEVGSGSHGAQTGLMLARLESVLIEVKPDIVIVRGDTNSTLAGALASVKLHIPLAHIEAGLRSFNKEMPEEINRIVTDHVSDLLFCPSESAVANLRKEGVEAGVHLVGDVMYDAVLFSLRLANSHSTILSQLGLTTKDYVVATVHRAENTESEQNLRSIVSAFNDIDKTVVFPIHPRTANVLRRYGLRLASHVQCIEPVSYFDMLMLVSNAKMLLTDSGGLQKEAYFLKTPCLTLRNETEWVETVQAGWNVLVGANTDQILHAATSVQGRAPYPEGLYGDGRSASKIVKTIIEYNSTV